MKLDGEPTPYGIGSSHEMLDTLLEYVWQNGRVCPHRWHALWKMLPGRRQIGGGWQPPLPLILAASYAPATLKMKRLEEHIRYADAHGVLVKVDRYLREGCLRANGLTSGTEGQFAGCLVAQAVGDAMGCSER